MALRENPVVKRVVELGEEQAGKMAQQLFANEAFTNAVQKVVANSLKAKGVLDKNLKVALSAMNLPSSSDLEGVRQKLSELEETMRRLEESVARLSQRAK